MKCSHTTTFGLGLLAMAASASPIPQPSGTVTSLIPAVTNHPHRETEPPHPTSNKPSSLAGDDTQSWARTQWTCEQLPKGDIIVGDLRPHLDDIQADSPEALRSRYWGAVRNFDRKLDELEKRLDCVQPVKWQDDKNDAPMPGWVDALRWKMGVLDQQIKILGQIKDVLGGRKYLTDRLPKEKMAVNPGLHEWSYDDVLPNKDDSK